MENGQGTSTSVASNSQRMTQLPWLKCVQGCPVDENREVYSLGCLHSICSLNCLEKFKSERQLDGKLFCLICKLPVNDEDLNRKLKPKDVFINKPDYAQSVEVKCSICIIKPPAVASCQDCPDFFCEACKRHHLIQNSTHSHIIRNNVDQEKQKEIEQQIQLGLKCQVHNNKPKSKFCLYCSEKICGECAESPVHEGHEIRSVQSDLFLLKSKANAARKLYEKCNDADVDLKRKTVELCFKKNEVERNIDAQIAAEIAMVTVVLKDEGDKRKKELDTIFKMQLNELKTKSQDVAMAKAQSLIVSNVVSEIVNHRDDGSASKVAKLYEPILNNLSENDTRIRGNYDEFVGRDEQLWFDVEDNNRIAAYQNFGRIEYGKSTGAQETDSNNTTVPMEREDEMPRLSPAVVRTATPMRSTNHPIANVNGEGSQVGENPVASSSNSPKVAKKRGRPPANVATRISQRKRTNDTAVPGCSSSLHKKTRSGRPRKRTILDTFREAPGFTLERPPKRSRNEVRCELCLEQDPEEGTFAKCSSCTKLFHLSCHAPALAATPSVESRWTCNFCTTKSEIDQQIAGFPLLQEDSEKRLVVSNQRHFQVACHFVMKCYKLPKIYTMRWGFHESYMLSLHKKKVPYTLKYIRYRLTNTCVEPFVDVKDFMHAFRQMFLQAFLTYRKLQNSKWKQLADAGDCFTEFRMLVKEYYPECWSIFDDVDTLTNEFFPMKNKETANSNL